MLQAMVNTMFFGMLLNKVYQKKKRVYLLIDYARIPPGSNSDALCETTITWHDGSNDFKPGD